ncbi:MAG: hypothetical protein IJT43_09655 [Stomatobaculum sp.]|nr:hypothetical protein [Stomatobaculum sp.]
MWFENTVFYQMYPLTLCGAPERNEDPENDALLKKQASKHRILGIRKFIPHLKKLGIGAVYLNPVFESDSHGYDTRDYRLTDSRLGTNEDLKTLCKEFHDAGIRVVLDGVFNHVGRGFFAFRDLQKNRESSSYRDWFKVNFSGDSPFHDGFWYEGWEGHYELVKLNLDNPAVQNYLMESIDFWFREFDIDGIRLDVAYLLPLWFISMIKDRIRSLKPDAFLLGEILGDNARRFYDQGHVDAITDYPLYKALWSALNSLNFFELAHTIKRTYGEMYRGLQLFSFADNHDVERIASKLTDPEHLPLVYALLFTLPGIPCIYYGSEWGVEGKKERGSDASLRPEFKKPESVKLTKQIAALVSLRNKTPELARGSLADLRLTNRAYAYVRELDGNRSIIAVNADSSPVTLDIPGCGAVELPATSAWINRRGTGFIDLLKIK